MDAARRAPGRRSAYGEKQISSVLSGSQGERIVPLLTQSERAAAAKKLFERQATQRSRREFVFDEQRPVTPPTDDVQSELERSVARSAEQERIRVEAMRLRNKLAQERLSAIDPTVVHRLEGLEQRVHALTLELEGTRRHMSTLTDTRLALEGMRGHNVNAVANVSREACAGRLPSTSRDCHQGGFPLRARI